MTEQEIYDLKIDELSDEEVVKTAENVLRDDIASGKDALAKAWGLLLLFLILAILIGAVAKSEFVLYIAGIPALLCMFVITEQTPFNTIRWKKKTLQKIENSGAEEARRYLREHQQQILSRYQNFPPETRKKFIVLSEEDEAVLNQKNAKRKRHAGKDK